jgi:hypothetical protein
LNSALLVALGTIETGLGEGEGLGDGLGLVDGDALIDGLLEGLLLDEFDGLVEDEGLDEGLIDLEGLELALGLELILNDEDGEMLLDNDVLADPELNNDPLEIDGDAPSL